MENIDEKQIITVDLSDENTSTVVNLTYSFVDELEDFKDDTKKSIEQATKDIKSLTERLSVYADAYDQIKHSYENFLERAKHVEVSVPYEKGTYLRACGYTKTVSLYDLLGQNPIVIPKV